MAHTLSPAASPLFWPPRNGNGWGALLASLTLDRLPVFHGGHVIGIENLHLVWEV